MTAHRDVHAMRPFAGPKAVLAYLPSLLAAGEGTLGAQPHPGFGLADPTPIEFIAFHPLRGRRRCGVGTRLALAAPGVAFSLPAD